MVQVGEIEYHAVVTGAGEAKGDAEDVGESFTQMGEQAEASSGSVGILAGTFGSAAVGANQAADEADDADTQFTLLRGTVGGTTRALGRLFRLIMGGTALSTLAGVVGRLATAFGGITLSGVLGSVTTALGKFVGWLAAGSAGALAVAGAIGAAVGLFAVWILEITGVLDMITKLGTWLSNKLPGWARDGVLAVIGVFAGPLAAIGAFIVGFIEGGFDEGFARAREVIDIFAGAFERTIDRLGFLIEVLADDTVAVFTGIADTLAGAVETAFNATVPSSVSVPSVTIGGGEFMGEDVPSKTFGGGSIDLPQLQTGGMIEQAGIAQVHEGEAVIPEPIVAGADSGTGGTGGGDTTVEVDTISIDMSGEFDPSDVSRRELDSLANRLVDLIGDKTNRRAGVR